MRWRRFDWLLGLHGSLLSRPLLLKLGGGAGVDEKGDAGIEWKEQI
jgi:hypothetical protein